MGCVCTKITQMITPDPKREEDDDASKKCIERAESEDNPESFFDLVLRCQSGRMDEQRAVLNSNKENRPKPKQIKNKALASVIVPTKGSSENMLEMINDLQSERIDSQRAELLPVPSAPKEPAPGTSLPGLRAQHTTRTKPEDDFLEMIARVQGSRLEDQRTELPRVIVERPKPRPAPEQHGRIDQPPQMRTRNDVQQPIRQRSDQQPRSRENVPDDDFFVFLMRAQSRQMEDQRATIPTKEVRPLKHETNPKK